MTAIEAEIRQRASAGYDELLDEAIANHEEARQQTSAALESLAAAQARARGAYTAAQAVAANAGVMHLRMRDVPNVEQIVRDDGIEPLIHPHNRDAIAA